MTGHIITPTTAKLAREKGLQEALKLIPVCIITEKLSQLYLKKY